MKLEVMVTLFESACGMVDVFSQTEATRLNSHIIPKKDKKMLVNSFQTWSEQNICVGYDPNNGQLPSRMQNELVNSQFIDQNLSFTYDRGQPIAGSQVQVAR